MRVVLLAMLGIAALSSFPLLAQDLYLRLPLVDSEAGRPLDGCPVQVVVTGPRGGELIRGTPGPGGVLEREVHISPVVSLTVSAAGYLPAQVTELHTVRAKAAQRTRVYLVPAEPVRLTPLTREAIPWAPGHPLTWADFRGMGPSDPGIEAARIHIVVSYRFSVAVRKEGDMWRAWIPAGTLGVQCAMDPTRSWVRPGAELPALLAHEQGHFDLAEVYRRLLKNTLSRLVAQGKDKVTAKRCLEEQATETAQGILARLEAAQLRYDEETMHGTDAKAQSTWLSRIRTWLANPDLAP